MNPNVKFITCAVIIGVTVVAAYKVYELRMEKVSDTVNLANVTPLRSAPAATLLEGPRPVPAGTAPLELAEATAHPAIPVTGAASQSAVVGPSAAEQNKQATIQAALGKMQSMLASGQRDPRAFADALADVEKANGSPIMGGVNLDALRRNIEIASQMQQLSQQMQAIQANANTASQPDAQVQTDMQQKRAQLQALAKQLSTGIMQAASPAVSHSE